jgi:glucose-6-phosphate-specific signal transduction histidine kinase
MGEDHTTEVQKRLDAARAKLAALGGTRDAKTRREISKTLSKKAGDKRALRHTGRDHLFNFRCREGLHEICKAQAAKHGLKLAEWMENQLIAAIEADGIKLAFDKDTGRVTRIKEGKN